MRGLFIKNSSHWHLRLRSTLPGTIILACACAILLLTAPTNGDFWWFDAPGHAMNGVFVRDFVAAMPWRDPVGFAIDYYMRYPAVTVLFYPPLFPVRGSPLRGVRRVAFRRPANGNCIFIRFRTGDTTTGAALDVRHCRGRRRAYGAWATASDVVGPTGDAGDAGLRIPDLVHLLPGALSARRADLADRRRGGATGGR